MFTLKDDEDILGIGGFTENELLEYFGERHLLNAVRLIASNQITPGDAELIHEALCIVVSMYVAKYNRGEIEQDTVLH